MEMILFFSFLTLDWSGAAPDLSIRIKFTGILLCFLFLLLLAGAGKFKQRDRNLMLLAMMFTLLADVCLLLTDAYVMGVCFFIIVQHLYLYRLFKSGAVKSLTGTLLLRLVFLAGGILVFWFAGIPIDFLLIASLFYFIHILDNTIRSFFMGNNRRKKKWRTFRYGLLLFLFCDINVALFNLSSYISVTNEFLKGLTAFSLVGMWFFYLPSQILLAFSAAGEEP